MNIRLMDMSNNLEKHNSGNNSPTDVEKIQFNHGGTKVVVIVKLFLNLNKNIEDIKINLKFSEQGTESKLLEKLFWKLLT